jgi:hypothetical protein
MRILFIVPYVPNLIRVRSLNLIRNLASLGHKITVMTLGVNETQDIEKLKAYCDCVFGYNLSTWRSLLNAAKSLPTKTPLQAVYSWYPSMADAAIELLETEAGIAPFDAIHVEHLRGAGY